MTMLKAGVSNDKSKIARFEKYARSFAILYSHTPVILGLVNLRTSLNSLLRL